MLARAIRMCAVVTLVFLAPLTGAAKQTAEWTWLESSSFQVYSQLGVAETTEWAREFHRFVESLGAIYNIETRRLPPLTVLLFKTDRAFAPYRLVTESGTAKRVNALFGRRDGWSVVGLGKDRRSDSTRQLIQHEATHWFLSASSIDYPLWFDEGYAQAMSTFEVKDGKGFYGKAIPENLAYLSQRGLQPLEAFFRVDQDDALHHNHRFYPQAWALVHYGLFSVDVSRDNQLSKFLKDQRTMPTRTAFEGAFGKTYEEMDRVLSRYVRGGNFHIAVARLPEHEADLEDSSPNQIHVKEALGRLAIVSGNKEVAIKMAESLIAAHPETPEGFGLLAAVLAESGNMEAASRAASKSIALNSNDGGVYALEAKLRFERQRDTHAPLDRALRDSDARQISDFALRAMELGVKATWLRELWGLAMLNVDGFSVQDLEYLDEALLRHPTDGVPLLVKAAHANRSGGYEAARALLCEAQDEPRRLPVRMVLATKNMSEQWSLDRLLDISQRATSPTDLDALDKLIEDLLSGETVSAQFENALKLMSSDSRSLRRHFEAIQALEMEDFELAGIYWQETVDDPTASLAARRDAERALRHLSDLQGASER